MADTSATGRRRRGRCPTARSAAEEDSRARDRSEESATQSWRATCRSVARYFRAWRYSAKPARMASRFFSLRNGTVELRADSQTFNTASVRVCATYC